MRVVRASACALLVACATLAVPASPASAATSGPPVVKTNWYWAEKSAVVQGNALPALPDQADAAANVPAGDLAVAVINANLSSQDRVSAVGMDLTAIPQGVTFTHFGLTVPLDSASPAVQTTTAAISACENIDGFDDGPGAVALAKAPPISTPSCVPGVFDAAKGYTFDLTAIANDWSGGAPSNGISLVPTVLPTMAPFSVVLQGKNAITTSVDYSLPVTDAPADVPPVADVAPPVVPAVALPSLGPAAPGLQAQAPQTAPVPQPQVDPAPATRRVLAATGYVAPTTVPTTNWWLALLVGVVLLGFARVVLADPMTPAPVDARRRRFADVVRAGSTTARS